jgi:protein TonB
VNGQGAHIAWFLALSALLHAALLLVGNRPETPSIAPGGRVMQVSTTYRAPAAVQSVRAASADDASARRAPPHADTRRPARGGAPPKAARHRPAVPPRETPVAAPVSAPAADAPDAPASVPSSRGMNTVRQGAEQHLRASILRLVATRFRYPVLARRKGMQGIVRLQVRIETDGRISRLQVRQTSGYPVLDQAALQSLQLASVPDAAQWMNGQAIDIIIPVEYRLVGG